MRVLPLLIFLFCSFNSSENDFYKHIFNYRTRYDCFVAIPVYDGNDTFKYVIENHSLYNYMAGGNKNNLKYESYKSEIKQTLLNEQGIKTSVPLKELEGKWKFHRVVTNGKIDSVANLGRDAFIKYFFNSKTLKDGISIEDKNALIYQLFQWQIAVNIDDETGYLHITFQP